MATATTFSLRDTFARYFPRQAVKYTHVQGDFILACYNGDLAGMQKFLKLFPDALGWTGGQCSKGGGSFSNTTPLLSAISGALHAKPDAAPPDQVVQYLCAAGADVNGRNIYGRSPLYDVIERIGYDGKSKELADAVTALILCGADADLPAYKGETPRALAQRLTIAPFSLTPIKTGPDHAVCGVIAAAELQRSLNIAGEISDGCPVAVKTMPRIRLKNK